MSDEDLYWLEQDKAEAAAEQWAERAWLRNAEYDEESRLELERDALFS